MRLGHPGVRAHADDALLLWSAARTRSRAREVRSYAAVTVRRRAAPERSLGPFPIRSPRDVAGGVVGHGSAVVVDDLDVVPVGVQDERAVVAGVVDGALAGIAVVLVARGERSGVERPDGRVVVRREREVHVLR